jgi:hypothetical protein
MSNKATYDFLQEVFEWVFYNMPIHANNSYMRKLYDFYREKGGLSGKQLQALLDKINSIDVKPSFNPATLEAMIKKKAVKYRSAIPAPVEIIADDSAEFRAMIDEILQIAPNHKTVLFYRTKMENRELLSQPEKDNLKKFLKLLKDNKQ